MPPRPTWTGQLRLSLVSCPITLSPATSEVERIPLHQLNPKTGNRISLQPVDAETGEELERRDLVKGYELEDGRYVVLEPDELDELQIDSSRVLDLTTFAPRSSVDPLYVADPRGARIWLVVAQGNARRSGRHPSRQPISRSK